jgi:hypothetical protein
VIGTIVTILAIAVCVIVVIGALIMIPTAGNPRDGRA